MPFIIIGSVVLMIATLVFGPVLLIWALNTLFPVLAIPLTWATYFAAFVIVWFVRGGVTFTRK